VKTTPLNYAPLKEPDRFKVFQEAIENRYRYSRFYGNFFLSLVLLVLFRYGVAGASLASTPQASAITILSVITLGMLFIASRLSYSGTQQAFREILKLEGESDGKGQEEKRMAAEEEGRGEDASNEESSGEEEEGIGR
jgi:hypothetical protein